MERRSASRSSTSTSRSGSVPQLQLRGAMRQQSLRSLAPAPTPLPQPRVTFYDLPAELRIEIYKLALTDSTLIILPLEELPPRQPPKTPQALCRTSRQVRLEILPLIHALCPIQAVVTNFDFSGVLYWLANVPPNQQAQLCKNRHLTIYLTSAHSPVSLRGLESLNKWLHIRADIYRSQPDWHFVQVATLASRTHADFRRRAKRTKEPRKQAEFFRILNAPYLGQTAHVRADSSRRRTG